MFGIIIKGCDYIFYKGTKVEIWQDVFDIELIIICKDKKIRCVLDC